MPTKAEGNGVYVHLFHGRRDPDQDMDDWGEDGPLIGPFQGVHTTYRDEIKGIIEGEAEWYASRAPGDDMIYFRGVWYGDWTVVGHDEARELVLKGTRLCWPKDLTPVERHQACSRCGDPLHHKKPGSEGISVLNPRTGERMHDVCRNIVFGKSPDTSPLDRLVRASTAALEALRNVPEVGGQYDQQHSDTALAADQALAAVLAELERRRNPKNIFERENVCMACWCPRPCDCDE